MAQIVHKNEKNIVELRLKPTYCDRITQIVTGKHFSREDLEMYTTTSYKKT